MSFKRLDGQPVVAAMLQSAIRKGRVQHAYLFSGKAGLGKRAAARAFAKTLFCLDRHGDDACDDCPSCRKLDHGNHPDYYEYEPVGAARLITVEVVNSITERTQFKPFEAGCRVITVHEAHRIRDEAVSRFLKLLEEPPDNNIIILLAENYRSLKETIVSRCQIVKFRNLSERAVYAALEREYPDVAPERRRLAALLARGSFERAVQYVSDESVSAVLSWALELAAVRGSRALDMADRFIGIAAPGRQARSDERRMVTAGLDAVEALFSEMYFDAVSGARRLSECGLGADGAAAGFGPDWLMRRIGDIGRAKLEIQQNVTPSFVLDKLLLEFTA